MTRTALTYAPYQEFAFPCPGCGVEIRFGLEQNPPNVKCTKLINAKSISPSKSVVAVETFDGTHLIPVSRDTEFSPFIAASKTLGQNLEFFYSDYKLRELAFEEFWPQIAQLILHFNRKQWGLFNKQSRKMGYKGNLRTIQQRKDVLYATIERYSHFAYPMSEASINLIKQRLALAETTSIIEVKDLVHFFQGNDKHSRMDYQLHDIRGKWAKLYSAVFPIYIIFYWDDKKHRLTDYTLAQKRFDDLKSFYVDCFETLCRISVIAAGIEGIIQTGKAVVPKTKGVMSLDEFDNIRNGVKPDILKGLVIADLFVPFIDYKLRNGIGHHSARYDVVSDRVEYVIENYKGIQTFSIPYVLFCEKIVRLYGQLELVSLYINWLMLFKTKGAP